jgi:transforming growth factor-beta-induced protein
VAVNRSNLLHRTAPRRHQAGAALLAVAALLGTACADDLSDAPTTTAAPTTTIEPAPTTIDTTPLPPGEFDIVGTALGGIVFTQLAGMVVEAGLVEALRGGPFTVFAPTDMAFDKVPVDILHTIQDDPDLLTTVLTYHVVPGELNVADLPEGELETLAGPPLRISRVGDATYVNGNLIQTPDVGATNGVIHVLDDVLVPPLGDIVDVATTLPGFGTLADLVTQADLVDTLKGEGPFTVFAPLDAAFEDLPAATLDAVLADPELLTTVLTYHVLPGKLELDQLEPGTYTTVAGIDLEVTKEDGVTFVDGIAVAVGNVQATNGVIHVIGTVLVPET